MASGATWRNSGIWKQERESAITLCTPGMCWAETIKLCEAATRERLHYMWTVRETRGEACHSGQIVAVEADLQGVPPMSPDERCQDNGVEFLVQILVGGSLPVKPFALIVGPEVNSPRAVLGLESNGGAERHCDWPMGWQMLTTI